MKAPATKTFEVQTDSAGQRLDLFLTLNNPEVSRSQIKYLINNNAVKVNSEIEFHPQYRVKNADKIELKLPVIEEQNKIRPTKIPLDLIYESDHIIALNKPAGLVVHPGSGHWKDTLANGIKYYLQSKHEDVFDAERAGLIHRLDKATSGIMVVAKKPEALWYISKQFAERKIKKYYLALVKGRTLDEFSVALGLGRDKVNRQKMSSRSSHARTAHTDFVTLLRSENGKFALLLVKPLTGRTHQIRVHLQEKGLPIVGDDKYGGIPETRLMLHAFKIELIETPGAEQLQLNAPIPSDFMDILVASGLEVKDIKNALDTHVR